MILVVSFHGNPHVEAVLAHVERPVTVFDVADFPSRAVLSARFGDADGDSLTLVTRGGTVDAREVGAVWYRREHAMELDPRLTHATSRLFAWSESTEAIVGLWRCLDCFWMNPPPADEVGQRKLRQLQVAREVGLPVPDTLVTNDPEAARSFVTERLGAGVIRKAFRNIPDAPRSTSLVTAEDLGRLGDVRFAPVTFQSFVPADLDLRVVVVEDEVFATSIKSEPEYRTDYRPGIATAELDAYELPEDVATALLTLHRRLGLVFGASDFRVTPEGEHVFLEVNPAGEYLFACERTGQPVPQAIAATLSRHDRQSTG